MKLSVYRLIPKIGACLLALWLINCSGDKSGTPAGASASPQTAMSGPISNQPDGALSTQVCTGDPDDGDTDGPHKPKCRDADGDGYYSGCQRYNKAHPGPDCDDSNPNVYPGAPEICDGVDNQCPGDAGYGVADEVCSWAAHYGDENPDVINAVEQTGDGGYIAVGQLRLPQNQHAYDWSLWVLRLDTQGNIIWERTFFELGHSAGNAVLESADHGFVIAGYVENFPYGTDSLVVKISPSGEIIWKQIFSGGGYSHEMCTVNAYNNDPPYDCHTEIVSIYAEAVWIGNSRQGSYIVSETGKYVNAFYELDSAGNLLGIRSSPLGEYSAIAPLSDGGFVMAGTYITPGTLKPRSPPDYGNLKIQRVDQDLNVIWSRTFGGSGVDRATSVHGTSDGGFAVAGITDSWGAGCTDYLVLKLDAAGNELWHKTYGGEGCEGSPREDSVELEINANDDMVLLGQSSPLDSGDKPLRILKLDSQGNVKWDHTFEAAGDDNPSFLKQTSDGGYILAFYKGWPVSEYLCYRCYRSLSYCEYPWDSWDDGWLIKLDQNGNCNGTGCP